MKLDIKFYDHQTIEDCKYDTDNKEGAFHVGGFYQGKLITVASFCLENNPFFSEGKQYRLRAMVSLEEYRNLGAGRSVVQYGESLIKEKNIRLLWCKGRTAVQEYFSKLGFKPYDAVFGYSPIGPYIIMYKELVK